MLAAVTGLDGTCAPGPDRFMGSFYQHYWKIVSFVIWEAIRFFYINHTIPVSLNACHVTLLPKFDGANVINNFRLIVLGNFLFKIIKKVVSTRFGLILSRILTPFQFLFIPGRKIRNYVALASEASNKMLSTTHVPGMALKNRYYQSL